MANIKTAISIEQNLFDKVNALSLEMKIPRSRLFSIAVENFIRQKENKRMLERINAAHDDSEDNEEQMIVNFMRTKHRKIVKGQW